MIFTNLFFIGGIFCAAAGLFYLSSLPPPEKTPEEIAQEEEFSKRNKALSKEERKQMMQDALKDQLQKYNPGMTQEDFESATSNAKERQKAFLRKLDPITREYFVNQMKEMKKRMIQIEKMSPEQIEDEARAIEANQFRMMCLKFVVLLVFVWITGSIWFEVSTPLEVKDKIVSEFQNFFSGVKNVATKNAMLSVGGSSSTAEFSTDL